MSTTSLKIIAVICMTLDHLSTYLGAPLFFRYIGRFAAVIFFFCAAEGAVHTKDRRQYLLRLYKMCLLMTALSAVVPFILGGWFPGREFPHVTNNIFTALVPGVWLIDILEHIKTDPEAGKKRLKKYVLYQIAVVPAVLLVTFALISVFPRFDEELIAWPAASLILSEGGIWLTIQIILFYLWRDSKKKLAIGYLAYCAVYTAVMLPQLPARIFWFVNAHFPRYHMLISNCLGIFGLSKMEAIRPFSESLLKYNFQCFMVFALPLLLMYNGRRGKGFKRFFYIYYPAHIYVLYLIGNL